MSRLIKWLVCVIPALTLAACISGSDFSRVSSTQTPFGPDAKVLVDKSERQKNSGEYYVYDGEVFQVKPDGVVVLQRAGRLVFIPWAAAQIQIESLGISTRYTPPASSDFELMRLTSRHPHGLTPDQLKEILTALKQDAILEVRR